MGKMKYGKYYVTGAIVLLLAGGGIGVAISRNNNTEEVETHKSVKSSSSSSHKDKKHSVKKSSSKSSSEVSSSEASSEQVSSSSVVTENATDSDFVDGQPTSNTTLTAFLNKYGVTPAQWLVQNKGMSIEDALYATPDEQETSGELQSEWAYKQGTHDEMTTDENEQEDDGYWSSIVREDNADFYGEDGAHYHNDDQGHTYSDDGTVIGKGSDTVGMDEDE